MHEQYYLYEYFEIVIIFIRLHILKYETQQQKQLKLIPSTSKTWIITIHMGTF